MQYRALGTTGLEVSAVGLGALRLGNLSQGEADSLIARALDGGVNYIDTARTYGGSEERLGIALEGRRERVLISTKCIYRELPAFTEAFGESLRLLRTDYIDVYYLHDVSTREAWERLRDGGILSFLQDRQREGAVRHIGVSTHDCEIGAQMLRTGLFEVCMLAYNASNTEAEEALLPTAREMGVGTVVMKPFGGGVLTEERSAQLDFSITAEQSLRFCVSREGIDTVIPGLDRPEYLETALKVAQGDPVMTPEERTATLERVTIRGKSYCRGCDYCRPCPQGLPISQILGLYNRWEIVAGVDWARKHQIRREYTDKVPLSAGADRCTACGACLSRCPYNLPIPDLMARAAKGMERYE